MGLDTTHNAWHGPYSSFNNFRRALLKVHNGTDLFEYQGYESRSETSTCKKLSEITDKGMFALCNHSDCDGEFTPDECRLISNSIDDILSKGVLDEYHTQKAKQFQDGLLLAYKNDETLEFH